MNDPNQYDADYFLRGRATGKSLYENYRWLPDLTIPMARAITAHCGMRKSRDTILDFGCARGYLVKALRQLDYLAYGYDVSEWAVQNVDLDVRDYITGRSDVAFCMGVLYDWVVAKDVLEHVEDVGPTIDLLMATAKVGVFVVVPLGYGQDGYVVPEYESDTTHVHRLTLPTWAGMFMRPGWKVEAVYRVPGVKDNYAQWEMGNGFVTARRIYT